MCKTKKGMIFENTRADSPCAVAYVRSAIHDPDSVAAQVARIHHYIDLRGWELTCIYADTGQSGLAVNRPALQRLLQDVKAGLVAIIVVERFDRLFRTFPSLLRFVRLVHSHNVSLVSLSEDSASQTGAIFLDCLIEKAEGQTQAPPCQRSINVKGETG